MPLLELQAFLARLYTDDALRERFFADPHAATEGLGLSAEERRELAGLNRAQVERFARSLVRKRLGYVREHLPVTARLLDAGFGKVFQQYCTENPSAMPPAEEAQSFAAFLLACPGSLQEAPPWTADTIRCEQLRLEVLYAPDDATSGAAAVTDRSRPTLTSRARVAEFGYDMDALYPALLRGQEVEAVEAQPERCWILIGRVRGAMRVKLRRVNAPTALLLRLCDGTRTVDEIVRAAAAAAGVPPAGRARFSAECRALLQSLADSLLVDVASNVDGSRLKVES